MPIKNSKIHKSASIINKELVNIYGCEIYENTKIGPFVEIQKDVIIGKIVRFHLILLFVREL